MTPTVDKVSTMLDSISVRSVVYCRSDLGAPWGFRVASSPQPKFHLVLSGPGMLTLEEGDELALGAGDLVLLPQGSGHVMRDQPKSRVRPLDRILADHPVDRSGTMRYGGRGPKTLLLCGEFTTSPASDVLAWLPRFLVLDSASSGLGRWIDPMFDLVRGNAPRSGPGAAAVLAKVADVFLTDVLRHYLASSDAATVTELTAVTDQPIADAVRLMHEASNESWTIGTLARRVGMSRSSFASRFRAALDTSPMAYLTRLRLGQAAGILATSTKPLGEVARSAGYDNESSFSKAFSRHYGQAPGEYRRTHRMR